MAKPSKRALARRLCLRVASKNEDGEDVEQTSLPNGPVKKKKANGRVTFEDTKSPYDADVRAMWQKVNKACSAKLPSERQPFSVIEGIVDEYGPRIWNRMSRRHLLEAGEHGDCQENLYWDDHRQEILEVFAELYGSHGGQKSRGERAKASQKRKRTLSDSFEDDYDVESDSSDATYTENESQMRSTPRSPTTTKKSVPLAKTHLDLKDSTNTYTAQFKLGHLDTLPNFFATIKGAFWDQNNCDDKITQKGGVLAVQILFTNLAPSTDSGIESPFLLERGMPKQIFTIFREFLRVSFDTYRKEELGEQLLLIGTVLFENDYEEC